jgi:excisionase family DNA binding protein
MPLSNDQVQFDSSTTKLLKVAEVSSILNISERQVWRLSSSGKLPSVSIGPRTTRWRRVDVERFIARLV